MRRFTLHRDEDVSGVSGTGVIVEGIEFTDGAVAYRWRGTWRTTTTADSIETVERIHGHDGKTRVVWLDEP
jgi:hypothetical protein